MTPLDTPERVCWVDGRLAPLDEPAVRADDSAYREGRGCFTTVRIEAGAPRFAERHVTRLVRGARELGLGELGAERVRGALRELAAAAFEGESGIVRFQVSRDGAGGLHLVGVPRPLGPEPSQWRAIALPSPHPGGYGGHKVSGRLALALALDAADDAGADEALLFDAAGRLVEGARSNLFLVDASGAPCTPALAGSGVAGVGRELVLERVPEVCERAILRSEVRAAREIVAVNAARGPRPITRLDARPVGDGRPGPFARRLAAAFAED